MRHLKNILDGWRFVLALPMGRDYPKTGGGFARDAENLRGDFSRVGNDMRKVLKRDQQAYERSRKR